MVSIRFRSSLRTYLRFEGSWRCWNFAAEQDGANRPSPPLRSGLACDSGKRPVTSWQHRVRRWLGWGRLPKGARKSESRWEPTESISRAICFSSRKQVLSILALLVVALLPLSVAAQTARPSRPSSTETAHLLSRLAEIRKQAGDTQTSFHEKRTLPFMEKPLESTGTLAFHPPDSFQRKVDQGSLTVCNGKTLWIYYPDLRQVEIYDLAQTRFLTDVLSAMTATLSDQQLSSLFHCTLQRSTADGATLILIPRQGVLRKVASKLILALRPDFSASSLEIFSPGGDRTLTTFGKESRVRLAPEMFEFRPPPGTRVSRPLAK